MTEAFDISFDDLPQDIPLFPLPRVILLPRVQLPLNIFEPRYLSMVDDAMSSHKLIGMIQPQSDTSELPLCKIGGVGRIVSYSETDDGRYLITLKGVCRFTLPDAPVETINGYLQGRPDWQPFVDDFTADTMTDICRDTMVGSLHAYFDQMGMSCDQWEQIRQIGCEKLISTLSVVCPFESEHKQALLEAATLAERARLLHALLEAAVREGGDTDAPRTCH